jgi:hypothetical protein
MSTAARRFACILALPLLFALSGIGPALAQPTLNIAPRIQVPGFDPPVRSLTLCQDVPASSQLVFTGWSVSDPDAIGDVLVRIDLEPGGAGASTILIPDLAGRPGVTIIRVLPERIRFTAPLATAAAALADLLYNATTAQLDVLDIGIDDQQLPPLTADVRLFLTVAPNLPPAVAACKPPPDLLPASDTGVPDDDITEALSLDLAVSGVAIGDLVTLLDDDVPVADLVAAATTLTITDPAPAVGATHLYSVTVNGEVDGSAGWSVAVLNGLFVDGFEDPPPPP